VNTTFRVSIRSGAVSTSVPSRSKTTVKAAMLFGYPSRRKRR
jgi:hypothetical protein